MPKLSPEGFRTAATALRERPVKNPLNFTEPAESDPSDPFCRVCFRAALAAGFPPGHTREEYDVWLAATNAVECLPNVCHSNLTEALDVYGPEFCAQLCEGIADEMENEHA
jgi:hypothetical protein